MIESTRTSTRKIAIVTALVLTALLAGSAYFLLREEPLNREVVALMKVAEDPAESPAFFYLLGMRAAEGADPEALGRRMFETWEDSSAMPEELMALPEPDRSSLCGLRDDECLTSLANGHDRWAGLLEEHAVLRSRFRSFCAFEEFTTQTEPDFSAPVVPYQHLISAARLSEIAVLQALHAGDAAEARRIAQENVDCLRAHFTLQDVSTGRVVLIVLLSEALDIASLVGLTSDQAPIQVHNLSAQERDITRIASLELLAMYRLFDSIVADGPDLQRATFKVNVTANELLPAFLQGIAQSVGSHEDFMAILDSPQIQQTQFQIGNLEGQKAAEIFTPDYSDLVGRQFDLDAKIELFQLLMDTRDPQLVAETFENPYFGESRSALIDDTEHRICFDGPLEDQYGLRCLLIRM